MSVLKKSSNFTDKVYMLFRNKLTVTTMFNRRKKYKHNPLTNQLLRVQTYKTLKETKLREMGLANIDDPPGMVSTELLHESFVFL